MNRQDFRFLEPMRVRWAEVDMQKIVFNAHYLMYFDTAVAGYWRALALPYHEAMERLQGDLYVRKATVEYLGSARYEDRCEVGLRCARIGQSSITFVAAMFRGETLLVHGELVYVFADPATQSSRPVPQALRELFTGYEAGEPVVRLQRAAWASSAAELRALRHAVLVEELGLPDALAGDEADGAAAHVVARNRFDMLVACGRLVALPDGRGQIGRMAVAQSVRAAGLGRSVLEALLEQAREQGLSEVLLHAQPSLVPYYASAGFVSRGERFAVGGLEHQEMVRRP